MNKLELTGDQSRQVGALRRFPEHRPFAGRLSRGFAVDLDRKLLASNQLSITRLFRGVALYADCAIGGGKLFDGRVQLPRRHLQ